MNDKEFLAILQKAVRDEEFAILEIIKMYENLIIKNSFVNGRFDSDCKAYIESCFIKAIKNFEIF